MWTINLYKSFSKNILLYMMSSRLSKIRSVHTYVMPWTVYFGWICTFFFGLENFLTMAAAFAGQGDCILIILHVAISQIHSLFFKMLQNIIEFWPKFSTILGLLLKKVHIYGLTMSNVANILNVPTSTFFEFWKYLKIGKSIYIFCDKNSAKITLGIKIVWKFISEGVNE